MPDSNKDSFFDSFDDDLEIDWSKVSIDRVNKLYAKLSDQDIEKVFSDLRDVTDSNNKKKSIIATTFTVLQVAVKLGLKVI